MTLFQDLRYAVRTAWRDRGFSLIAVLTLALGIGANTALFTIVNAIVLAPLPFRSPEQLVRVTVDFNRQHVQDIGLSIPELFDLRGSGLFDAIAGVWPVSANLTETDEPERVETALVDANYFSMLGVTASIGRVFGPSDAQPGIAEAAVISHALWQRRFGGDPGVLGKRIRVDNDLYSIIGVAPESFRHPGRGTETDVEVWAPAGWLASPFSTQPIRRAHILQGAIGRLRPGITPAAAQAKIDALSDALRAQFSSDYPPGAGWALRAIPLHDDLVGAARPALLTLLGAVGFVLLIACANVANLLLARSSARQREIAIRRALGAGRARLVSQLLTESVLLAVVGGLVGLFVAVWSLDGLVHLSPSTLPRLHDVSVNGVVLGFTAALAILTGIVFGLMPAIQGSHADLHEVMRDAARSASAAGRVTRARGVLVIAEFALALVLLVGAALLVQSFWRLQRVSLGFNPQSVLTARIWLPQPNDPKTGPYFTHDARVSFYRRVLDRVAVLPGVQAAGGISNLPLGGTHARLSFTIEGQSAEAADLPNTEAVLVTSGYFRALGVDLLRGRIFDEHDDVRAPGAVVVSDGFARRFFEGADAVGKRISLGSGRPGGPPQPPNWLTIVGVVRDVRGERLESGAAPLLYRSVLQSSNLSLTLVARASGDPSLLAEAVRRAVRAVDPNEPVFRVRTMDEVVAAALAERRFTMLLLALFAATALALSAIGIYGVMAYVVTQRTREIGIRMALGASPRAVLGMVLAQGAKLVVAGIVAGLLGAVALTRAISALLFGVSPRDPATLAALSIVLSAIALIACYVPARRATRVDPIRALRYE
jgi:predicted permease